MTTAFGVPGGNRITLAVFLDHETGRIDPDPAGKAFLITVADWPLPVSR